MLRDLLVLATTSVLRRTRQSWNWAVWDKRNGCRNLISTRVHTPPWHSTHFHTYDVIYNDIHCHNPPWYPRFITQLALDHFSSYF